MAGVLIAFKDVVPGELDLLLRHAVVHEKKDDPGNANLEGDAMDGLIGGAAGGNIAPFVKIKGAEGTVRVV